MSEMTDRLYAKLLEVLKRDYPELYKKVFASTTTFQRGFHRTGVIFSGSGLTEEEQELVQNIIKSLDTD